MRTNDDKEGHLLVSVRGLQEAIVGMALFPPSGELYYFYIST